MDKDTFRFVIITGMSGAGKTNFMQKLEDMGYYCVDNLPPVLIVRFADLCWKSTSSTRHVAVVTDIRGGSFFDALPQALDELEKRGFISEQRVVDSVIHSKASRFGTARLVQELRSKGLDDEMVRNASEQLRDTELERARELWCKRFGTPPADIKEKAKQLRFMASRGFSSAVVLRVLRDAPYSAFDENDDQA